MGSAIIAGLRGLASPPAITVYDPVPAIRERHSSAGITCVADPADAIPTSGVVVLAVKPQVVREALAPLREHLTEHHVLISILAGTTIHTLESLLNPGVRVIRCMPNTPMAIGAGMAALAAGSAASEADLATAEAIFAPAAEVLRVNEDRMDAITAVSGSGPAYLFRFAEAQLAAAEALGFTTEEARLLVGQTLKGSIDYLLSQPEFPAARLREQVTSPGGTTAAALQVLEEADFGDLINRALAAAAARSRELAAN